MLIGIAHKLQSCNVCSYSVNVVLSITSRTFAKVMINCRVTVRRLFVVIQTCVHVNLCVGVHSTRKKGIFLCMY